MANWLITATLTPGARILSDPVPGDVVRPAVCAEAEEGSIR